MTGDVCVEIPPLPLPLPLPLLLSLALSLVLSLSLVHDPSGSKGVRFSCLLGPGCVCNHFHFARGIILSHEPHTCG